MPYQSGRVWPEFFFFGKSSKKVPDQSSSSKKVREQSLKKVRLGKLSKLEVRKKFGHHHLHGQSQPSDFEKSSKGCRHKIRTSKKVQICAQQRTEFKKVRTLPPVTSPNSRPKIKNVELFCNSIHQPGADSEAFWNMFTDRNPSFFGGAKPDKLRAHIVEDVHRPCLLHAHSPRFLRMDRLHAVLGGENTKGPEGPVTFLVAI